MPINNTPAADNAMDLDVIMKDGLERFDLPVDEEAAPDKQTPSPAGTPQPGRPAGSPEAGDAADFRFKSHPEAEKGYKNLQSDFTRVSQENAELKRQMAATAQAEANQAQKTAVNKEFREFAATERQKMLDAIDALDPDDPDYKKNVATVQADYDALIYEKRLEMGTPAPQPSAASAAPQADAMPTGSAAQDDSVSPEAIRDYANSKITAPEIGLAADDPLFWTYALRAPQADGEGQPLSIDDQISWAVEQTLNYRASIAPPKTQDAAEQDAMTRATQEQGGFGRAATATPPTTSRSKNDTAYGLSDALAEAADMRRI